jgi:hypothetical protein
LKAKAVAKSAIQQIDDYQLIQQTRAIEEQRVIIEQDRENRKITFNTETQYYPADLFILKGFSFGQPVFERNPRWHDSKGYFTGRTSKK